MTTTKHLTMTFSALLTVASYSCSPSPTDSDESELQVVYGRDNRADFTSQTSSGWIKMSQNIALLVQNKELKQSNGVFGLNTQTLAQSESLCDGERFSDQPIAGFCTGFLIDDRTLITAGHCIRDEIMCKDTAFVFDFKKDFISKGSTVILPSSTVYSCNKVLFSQMSDEIDVAVIELDRTNPKFEPVTISRGSLNVGDSLSVIGHPNGLPMKLDVGGSVRHSQTHAAFFLADLDTFRGSSGSPVFDKASASLVGILVKGERDYEWDSSNQCNRVLKCKTGSCRGEEVLRAESIPTRSMW